MKPVQILCLALFCLSMVFAAPAPEPTLIVGGTSLVLPTLVGASGAAVGGAAVAVAAGLVAAAAPCLLLTLGQK